VATETEIWPYFLLMIGRKGIPAAILNGRMSETSCRRFGWFRFFLRHVLRSVHVFAMQSKTDCHRIIRIGADPRRVYLTGNMKFDVPVPDDGQEKRRALREEWGWREDCPALAAGSTHEGEEQILLDVYGALRKEVPRLRMILAPRHPERCGDLHRMCEEAGFSTRRRTQGRGSVRDPIDVLILDTMGELAGVYAAADFVFLGGTFVPIGGHNPLEPILYEKPVLFGPHTEKITDIAGALLDVGGGIRVRCREELLTEARRLIQDPERRQSSGRAAYEILARHRGATERNLAILRPFLYPHGVDRKP
jgi:3-deoxy-D-manno-octulosonic-acid transferase